MHLSYKTIGDTDLFHVWGAEQAGLDAVAVSGSQPYDPLILNLPPNSLAPIPIARIIDTEQLRAGVVSEGVNIGMAEYSNPNFFSDDTIFSPSYQTPTDIGLVAAPGPNNQLRWYLYRHPTSAGTYKLAVANALSDSVTLPFWQQQWGLDTKVMEDYGAKLFPRAIGYSTGLIDYFFRGKITDGLALLVTAPPDQPPPTSITVPNITVSNIDGTEQGGQGTIQLVLRYWDDDTHTESFPKVVVSQPVPINAGSSAQTITFPFSSLPFPTIPEPWGGTTETQYTPFFCLPWPFRSGARRCCGRWKLSQWWIRR